MKKILMMMIFFFGTIALMSSCGAKSARLGNIDPDDIEYIKDCRTNLCYAIIGAKQGMNITDAAESMGMACVPCDSLKNVEIKSNCEQYGNSTND